MLFEKLIFTRDEDQNTDRKKEKKIFMTKEEKDEKVLQAEERLKRAKSELHKAKLDAKAKARRELDHLKFAMGGIVVKYFPECSGFSELEMCRILGCAFKNHDVGNLIKRIVAERKDAGTQLSDLNREEDGTET